MAKKGIYIIPDGPYEVSGDIPLKQVKTTVDEEGASVEWVEGRSYEKQAPYHLCRCGRSGEKPFCNGTHEKMDFTGRETAHHHMCEEDITEYSGEKLTLRDNETLCASMRFCDRGENAWAYTENSADEHCYQAAVEEVGKCPSGRLALLDNDGNQIEPFLNPEIMAVESTVHSCRGPLWVKGGIEVEGYDCTPYEKRNRVTLCRCGESKNKPFCDSSHVYCPHMQGFDK